MGTTTKTAGTPRRPNSLARARRSGRTFRRPTEAAISENIVAKALAIDLKYGILQNPHGRQATGPDHLVNKNLKVYSGDVFRVDSTDIRAIRTALIGKIESGREIVTVDLMNGRGAAAFRNVADEAIARIAREVNSTQNFSGTLKEVIVLRDGRARVVWSRVP